MKLNLRIIGIFLITLTSLILLGCSKTGQKAVESDIKTRFSKGTVIETTNYSYNEKAHFAEIKFKITQQDGASKEYTWPYTVMSDDYVRGIFWSHVPKDFRDELLATNPAMFLDCVTAYTQLYELLSEMKFAMQFMDMKIWAAKMNHESWDTVDSCSTLVSSLIEMYARAYKAAPSIVADKFPKPVEPFKVVSEPEDYIYYAAHDLRDWNEAVQSKGF